MNGHGIEYCWEDVPNRVATVEAKTQTLIVGAFGQRNYTVQSNQRKIDVLSIFQYILYY